MNHPIYSLTTFLFSYSLKNSKTPLALTIKISFTLILSMLPSTYIIEPLLEKLEVSIEEQIRDF